MTKIQCGIYEILNRLNLKRYIGSSKNISHRWNCHRSELRKGEHQCNHLQNAWNKHGEQNFIFNVIRLVQTEDDLLLEEQKEIDNFDFSLLYNENKIAGKPPVSKGEDHPKAKLNWELVREIRRFYSNAEIPISELCKKYSVSQRTMTSLIDNTTWTDPEYQKPEGNLRERNYGKNINKGSSNKKTKEQFIKESNVVHQNFYDYSKVEYKNNITKVLIICPFHGEFMQFPTAHIQGEKGCKECGKIKLANSKRYSFSDFVESASKIHNNKFSYPIQNIDSRMKIEIFCSVCEKSFQQRMSSHLQGIGCPSCSNKRKGKKKEEITSDFSIFLESLNKPFRKKDDHFIFDQEKFVIKMNDLCLNFPKGNLSFFTQEQKEKDFRTFHIFSDEWREKKEIVKSMIKHRLNLSEQKIFARKCEISVVSNKQAKEFFGKNHVSGSVLSRACFGLFFKEELVCCISVRNPIQQVHGHVLEIARFATKLNTVVVGGFQKLLLPTLDFAKQHDFDGLMTYADLRFGEGIVYSCSGFQNLGRTNLDYWYTDGKQRFFRFKFRAQNGFSEAEIAHKHEVKKVFGCGSNIFSKKI